MGESVFLNAWSAKDAIFCLIFTLGEQELFTHLTHSWSLSTAEDQEVHDSSISFPKHGCMWQGVMLVEAVSNSPFIFCHRYWRSWQESRFVKIQLRPSSLTTEGEKLGWKTSTPLNHSPLCISERALLSFQQAGNKQKKITGISRNKYHNNRRKAGTPYFSLYRFR